jgi:hypothetical protein
MESPRRLPGSTAARPTDRRQSGARKGTPSCTRNVALGCPHPGGVCRSWRRDVLLRGPAGLRRFRGSPDRQSVQVKGAEEGDARSRRGWPPLREGACSSLASGVWRIGAAQPPQSLERDDVAVGQRGQDGRRIVPPGERPSTSVEVKMGRERPRPRRAYPAPRPSAGSLTPLVSVPMSVTGASQDAVRSRA